MFNLEKMILNATKYDGERANPYTFSASMTGNTLLQNYLIIVHGSQEEHSVGDATLGSVFHKGMEEIVRSTAVANDEALLAERKVVHNLDNGWAISGTTDLEVLGEGVIKEIHDFKLVKHYAVKKILENPSQHSYAMQLHINRYIRSAVHSKLYIDAFAKDAKHLESESTFNQIEIQPISFEDTEAYLYGITDEIKQWVESGQVPPKCDDVWLRKLKTTGEVIASRCMLYCSFGKTGLCPHYKPNSRNSATMAVNW